MLQESCRKIHAGIRSTAHAGLVLHGTINHEYYKHLHHLAIKNVLVLHAGTGLVLHETIIHKYNKHLHHLAKNVLLIMPCIDCVHCGFTAYAGLVLHGAVNHKCH